MDLKRAWKKAVVTNIRYFLGMFLEELREIMTVRAVSVPSNMQTGPLVNTSQKHCYLCNFSSKGKVLPRRGHEGPEGE
jgi:hypothetical protein